MVRNDDDDFRVTRIRPVRSGGSKNDPIASIVSDLKKKFGGGGGGGNSGNGSSRGGGQDGINPRFALIVIVGLILLWGVSTSFYTVDVSEEGVVTRFGQYKRTTTSGLQFLIPFGIERLTRVPSKRVMQEEFGFRTASSTGSRSEYEKSDYAAESLMLTGDLNVADVEWILQYRIQDPWKYLFHARDVTRNIRDVSMSIMRRVVGDRLVNEVLTTGRSVIAEEARELTQKVLDTYNMGIVVEKIILQDVFPPERVKPAFNEVNAAKQEQEQTINNAERQYNKVIPEARGKAKQLLSDAEGYAIDIVNRAKGDAAQFSAVVAEYKKAPDVTRRRMYLDTIEQILSSMSGLTVIDDSVKGVLPLFFGNQQKLPDLATSPKEEVKEN